MSNSNNAYSYPIPTDARSDFRRLTPNGRAPLVAALTRKLVPEVQQQNFGQGYLSAGRRDKPLQAPDMGLLKRISDLTANDVNDAQSIFQILPETELAMQILVSSILAPKDHVTTAVNFTLDSNRFNSELAGSMLNVVTEHFEKIYKISELLKPSLEDALFLTGSYPLLILPESSIDQAINNPGRVSMESISEDFEADGRPKSWGFLGNARAEGPAKLNFSMEAYGDTAGYKPALDTTELGMESHVTVIDNPSVLRMSALQQRLAKDRTYHLLRKRGRVALKSADYEVSQEAYMAGMQMGVGHRQSTMGTHAPIHLIQPTHALARPTIGHPLVMKLPSESVIPVHQPSNPEKHLGYFVLLDNMGNPINTVSQRDYYADMSNTLNANASMGSQLLTQAKRAFQGQAMDRQSEIDEMSRIYGQFLEKELTDRLRNGIYGDQVEVTSPTEVYRVMLARAMGRQHTQLLYVPAEMLTYIAFDYNKYGIGQSLLQKSKILGGIRVLALFAETMASIKNSINRTRIDITLDPEDPNPTHTVEFLMTEYAKTRQGSFPLGATNPTDIVSFLQNASVDVAVQGNTRFPEVKFDVSERASNRVKPDSEMMKDLRDRHLMAMGLSPDMVDAGANAEFATSVVANNLLLAKRVLGYQATLEEFLQDFVTKYILADGNLMEELRRLIDENKDKLTADQGRAQELSEQNAEQKQALQGKKAFNQKVDMSKAGLPNQTRPTMESFEEQLQKLEDMGQDAVIMEFLQCILISLPKPDMITIDRQMEAYDKQDQAYEKALDAYINPAFLESHGLGSLAELVDVTKAATKADLMRAWMRDNNVMPELHDMLVGVDEDDKPDLAKNISEHMKSMGDSLLKVMYNFARQRQMTDPAVAKLAELVGENPGGDFGGGDTFGAPSGTDDFGGGMDDLSAAMPEMPEPIADEADASEGEVEQEGSEAEAAEEQQDQEDPDAGPSYNSGGVL
ncbi:hypothetical protein LUCX_290 [Xanthomonas phage vB_XciM_LucasX]|nr:hypothetical protein LUCX_290 [Xanthomonas phage vB_XciM_LucasX]